METYLADTALGTFLENTDEKNINELQELANEVHEKWVGDPFPFNDLAETDVEDFLKLLERA